MDQRNGPMRRRHVVAALGALAASPAFAQFRVEVTGVGVTQLPISIVPMRGEAESPQKIASIVQAVEQGRTIRANISKALRFLLSTNFSEILVTLGALALGVARPMSAVQYLWINLLSDVFPALALAMEPPEPDVMNRPPLDPREPVSINTPNSHGPATPPMAVPIA